jgi:HEAT repeat protein
VGGVGRLLRINPGEGRIASRPLALMAVTWSGFALGGSAVEGLLFARVGAHALPYLFILLGTLTAVVMLGMNALLARPRPQRLLLLAFPAMSAAILAMRGLLLVPREWLYSATWLAMMVLWTGATIVTWAIVATVHDTRQAKRLFPLYASGVIVGNALGGVATAPLASALGAENLLFIWAMTLALGFVLARSILRPAGAALLTSRRRRPAVSLFDLLAEGLRTASASPLLRQMSLLAPLFAALYFSVTLLFARAAAARFPDADTLAGFLGVFMAATSGTALLVALFAASRLSARFGVSSLILVLALLYGVGFTLLVGSMAFTALFAFRFAQMVWINGVWAGAWQALYNVVPRDRREGTRSFVDGIAFQAGVVCAGAVLVLAGRLQQPGIVALIGVLMAVLATVMALRLRRAYPAAVAAALRAGNPDVFFAEEHPFGGVGRDAGALSVAVRAGSDPDPAVRRMAMEILGEIVHRDARQALERALTDEDVLVRRAALRGLARAGPETTADGVDSHIVASLLDDCDATVRLAAVEYLDARNGSDAAVRPLLADADPRVRARAAMCLLDSRVGEEAREALVAMARSREPEWRAEAVRVLGTTDDGIAAAASAVADPEPLVRGAAVSALAGRDADAALHALVSALGDPDPSLRARAVDALVESGPASIAVLSAATSRPELEAEAMRALTRLHALDQGIVDAYVRRRTALAVRYAAFLNALGDERAHGMDLLVHSLRHASRRHALEALQVVSLTWGARAVEAATLAVENLEASEPSQRANALEMLEAVGEPDVLRPLIAVWEERTPPWGEPLAVLDELIRGPEPWLRACAAFVGGNEPQLRPPIARLAESDPDTLVREAAATALRGERSVEALSSLSVMERVVFLRRVPLFRDLSPADLKHVAEIASELTFSDGAIIAGQGEPGDEMHVVVSGCIAVSVSRAGKAPTEVARRTTGEWVGEMAVVSRSPRMATLAARGEVRTLVIDRRRFERILRERPEAALAVMRVLCDRLREQHDAQLSE